MSLCSRSGLRLFFIGCVMTAVTNFPSAFTHTSLNTAVIRLDDFIYTSFERRGSPMQEHEVSLLKSFMNSVWYAGQVAGALSSPFLCDRYGRKVAYLISVVMMATACGIQMYASTTDYPELLITGRIVTAIFSPLSDAALILYLQEISPTSLRGTMSSLYSTGYCIMGLFGMMFGHDLMLGHSLPVLLSVPVLAGIPSLIFTVMMPETPKFLWLSRKDKKSALKSLAFFQGKKEEHQSELDAMEAESGDCEQNDDKSSVGAIFACPALRKAFLLSICVLILTLPFYPMLQSSTYFFTKLGMDNSISQTASSLLMILLTVSCIISTSIVDLFPRRSLIISAGFVCISSLISFVLSSTYGYPYWAMGSIFGFIFAYGVGIGPIVWFIPPELVPLSYRSVMFCICYAVHSVLVVLTNFCTIPLFGQIGALCFVPLYIIPCSCALIYVVTSLPETKGRETHDIVMELRGKQVVVDNKIEKC